MSWRVTQGPEYCQFAAPATTDASGTVETEAPEKVQREPVVTARASGEGSGVLATRERDEAPREYVTTHNSHRDRLSNGEPMPAVVKDWNGVARVIRTFGALEARVLEPQASVTRAVVLCHGFGAPGDNLVWIGDQLWREAGLAASTAFVFPAGPLSLDSVGLRGSRAWWWCLSRCCRSPRGSRRRCRAPARRRGRW